MKFIDIYRFSAIFQPFLFALSHGEQFLSIFEAATSLDGCISSGLSRNTSKNRDFHTTQISSNIVIYHIYHHLISLGFSLGFFWFLMLRHVTSLHVCRIGGRQLGQDFLGRHGVLLATTSHVGQRHDLSQRHFCTASAPLLHSFTALRGAVAHLHTMVVAPNPDLTWLNSCFDWNC